jgi:V/A-type H+-transporting ATPase subunit E
MMAAEESAGKIIEKIKEDARREAESILEDARREAESILEDARRRAEQRRRDIIARGEKEADLLRQRIVANAKLNARKSALDAKEELISAVFEEAHKQLAQTASTENYRDILRELIKEGVASVGEDVEVLCRPEDEELLKGGILKDLSRELGVDITLSGEKIDSIGGVVVRAKSGRVEVNNTFETRLQRMKEALRSRIAKVLFTE